MSATKVMFGFAAGFAGGAIMGALLAPAVGSTTRRRISLQAGEAADEVKEIAEESVDALSERYPSMKGDAMARSEKGKGKKNGNSPHREA